MALVKCPECDNEISNYATSCPHCGYPMRLSDPHKNKSWRNLNLNLFGPLIYGILILISIYAAMTAGPKIRTNNYRAIDEAMGALNKSTNVFVSDEHAEYLGRKYGVDINNLSNTWERVNEADEDGRPRNGWNLTPWQQSRLFSPIFDQEGITATPNQGTSVANVIRDSGNYTEDESYMIRGLLEEGAYPGLLPLMPGDLHKDLLYGDIGLDLPESNSHVPHGFFNDLEIERKSEALSRVLPVINPADWAQGNKEN